MSETESAWNETNPEWWKMQVQERGEIAWTWLVNEWVERSCVTRGCEESVAHIITTAGGKVGMCAAHARWYLDQGPEIYPAEAIGTSARLRDQP